MTLFKIQVGELIQLNGHRYKIARMLETGEFLLEALDGKTTGIAITRHELERAFSKGEMEFVLEAWARVATSNRCHKSVDYDQVPEEMRDIVKRRHTYVKAVQLVDDLKWDPKFIGPMLIAAASQIGDDKPPHPQTVKTWYEAYLEADGDIRALIPQFQQRGSDARRLNPLVVAIMESKIERYYLSPERHKGSEIRAFIMAAVYELNKSRAPDEQLKCPARATVYAEIKKLDPYMVHAARYGQRSADRRFKQSGQYPHPKRPLEKVEIDHTKSDLFVMDGESRLPIGRPWITAAIDVYSRMVYGIHIGFVPPSFVSVMHCIRTGILPKSWLREAYPEIVNDWPLHGKAETVHCDNGKEFHSNAFEHAMSQLGIEIAYCSVLAPDQKGSIERFLGVVNRGLLQQQPGTTFSDIFDKEDYDPAKNAVITLSLLKAIVMKWICDVHHVQFHRGLGGVPIKVYQRAAAMFPPPGLPRHVNDLVVLFGRTVERTVQHTGIELNGLFYNSPALAILRVRLNGKKTPIRFDEENLGTIHVYDPLDRVYIPAPCTDPQYAEGLSLWQHDVIRNYVRKRGLADQDEVSVAQAKTEIQQMVESAWLKPSKTGHKQKMARWLGVGGAVGLDIVKDLPESAVPPVVPDEPEPVSDVASISVPRGPREGWGVEGTSSH